MKLKFYFILIISVTISIHAFASLNRVKSSKYIEIKKYVIDSIPFILSGLIMFLVLFNLNIAVKNQFSLLLLEIVIGVVLFFTVLSLQLLIKKCVNQYVFKRK